MIREILHHDKNKAQLEQDESHFIEPVLVDIDDSRFSGAVIVTESASDLMPEQKERYSIIHTAPMHVNIGEQDLIDWSFPQEQIFDYYSENKKIPTTSAVSPGDYEDLFMRLRQEYPDKYILHLCYSAVTTATWKSALIASQDCPGVIHIDTRNLSAGLGAIVCKVAEWLESNEHASSDEILEFSNRVIDKSHFGFVPSDLLYLKTGGRLSNAQFAGASLLSIKPIIELDGGKLVCKRNLRGKIEKVCYQMIDYMLDGRNMDKDGIVLLYSKGLDEQIRSNIEEYLKKLGYTCPKWAVMGGVISCHSGPCAFGFGGFEYM